MYNTSSGVLERWIDGNRVFINERETQARFGPNLKGNHFLFDIERYFGDCHEILGKWDCFENGDDPEEMRYNTITRLVIVAFVLLIIVSVREWLIAFVVAVVLIVLLWFTTIPTISQSTKTLKPHRCKIV